MQGRERPARPDQYRVLRHHPAQQVAVRGRVGKDNIRGGQIALVAKRHCPCEHLTWNNDALGLHVFADENIGIRHPRVFSVAIIC